MIIKLVSLIARKIGNIKDLRLTPCGWDVQVVRSLDPCSKGPRFETTFRPVIKCEERISQLSVIPGKKEKGITRCGHIERKDQVRTAR